MPLRLVRPGLRFRLISGPDDRVVGTVTSANLIRGLRVTLPAKGRSEVVLIEPVAPVRPLPPTRSRTHGQRYMYRRPV